MAYPQKAITNDTHVNDHWSRHRITSEATNSRVAAVLMIPCTAPTDFSAGSISIQSIKPAAAALSAPAMPRAAAILDAIPNWGRWNIRPTRSNNIVKVQAPTGISVSNGWRGCPSQDPFNNSLMGRSGMVWNNRFKIPSTGPLMRFTSFDLMIALSAASVMSRFISCLSHLF